MAAGGAHPRCTCDGRGVACALHCLPWLLCILGTFLLVLPKTVSAQQPGMHQSTSSTCVLCFKTTACT